MVTITVDNSESQVLGLMNEDLKALRSYISYQPSKAASYFSGRYQAHKISLINKNGLFPTGLLYQVIHFLRSKDINFQTFEKRHTPMPQLGLFQIRLPFTPYDEQMLVGEACRSSKRGIIVAPTGMGKSVMAALIINELQVPTLIVVPSLELKRQLTDSLRLYFGKDKVTENGPIRVENVDALDNKIPLKGIDCVIIDEFHHSGAKTYRKLDKKTWGNVYYKFGLTATPFRSQDNENILLQSVLSRVIYRIEYKEAVDKKFIVPLEAYYYEVPKSSTQGERWAKVYSDLVVNNQVRNKIIHDLLVKLYAKNISTLCLVKEIKHGEILASKTSIPFAHGENEDTAWFIQLFNEKTLKTLIGTTGVLGEGIDTKPAEYIIIAGLGKSKNAFMQQVGRGFRNYTGKESCKVILFKDNSHKWCKSHFKEQVKILKEEFGIEPVRLEL